MFEMEVHYWELGNFVEPKLPKKLLDMLKQEPVLEQVNEDYELFLSKWRELGPISALDIEKNNSINLDP